MSLVNIKIHTRLYIGERKEDREHVKLILVSCAAVDFTGSVNKNMNVLCYMNAVTAVGFYGQRVINSHGKYAGRLAFSESYLPAAFTQEALNLVKSTEITLPN